MSVYKTADKDPTETRAILVTCDCGHQEHAVHFSYFPDEEWPELFFEFHLKTWRNIFQRTWAALRYAFGYHCRYGEWDELVMTPRDARQLAEFLLEYAEIARKAQ